MKTIQAKDIPARRVLELLVQKRIGPDGLPERIYDVLCREFPAFPGKVIFAKLEAMARQELLDVGVSVACAWISPKGYAALALLKMQTREENDHGD